MVELDIIAPQEVAAPLQNRLVCDLLETRTTVPGVGRIVSWRGSTQEEYFSVLFVRGIFSVSVNERECQLNDSIVNYAMSMALSKAMKGFPGRDELSKQEDIHNYFDRLADKEMDEITFSDAMMLLNWTYKLGAKVDVNLLAN